MVLVAQESPSLQVCTQGFACWVAGLLLQFCLMCFAWVVSSIPRHYCIALHSQAYDCTGQPTPSHSATCSAAWSMRKLLCMCRGVNISCLRKLRKWHRRGPAGGR